MQRTGRVAGKAATPESAFAQALQEIRKERGISQEALGFESGYHRTYISLLERGLQNPSLRTILSLATALEVSATRIVQSVEDKLGRGWRRDIHSGKDR